MGIPSYNPVIIPISIYEEWIAQQNYMYMIPYHNFKLNEAPPNPTHMVDIQIEDAIHQLLFVYQLFRQ